MRIVDEPALAVCARKKPLRRPAESHQTANGGSRAARGPAAKPFLKDSSQFHSARFILLVVPEGLQRVAHEPRRSRRIHCMHVARRRESAQKEDHLGSLLGLRNAFLQLITHAHAAFGKRFLH